MVEYVDIWPDGTLCRIPINRSIMQVMEERLKIAVAFADLTQEDLSPEVLTGSLGIAKMQFLKEKLLPLTENIIMQDKIDVFNEFICRDI